jgi:molecular chaperone DnaK (HSP70)
LSFPEFIIGIDLGTTNSVVSYAREGEPIQVFAIPQLTGPGTIEKQDILPSAVLIPGENDTPYQALVLPWDAHATQAIGEFARDRGAEIPHRLIASAKSWLCHALVDRNKPILPWEGPDSHLKLSPVAASAAILHHIRDAWNYEMAGSPGSLR